jgi:hypothetical protein
MIARTGLSMPARILEGRRLMPWDGDRLMRARRTESEQPSDAICPEGYPAITRRVELPVDDVQNSSVPQEWLMTQKDNGFLTGAIIPSLPPQPAVPGFGPAFQETRE